MVWKSSDKLLRDAVERLAQDYEAGKLQFYYEADLQCHLFSYCKLLMETRGFPYPLQLFAEYNDIDLMLGKQEVLIEVKLEPNNENSHNPVVSPSEVRADLRKIESYAKNGKIGHFVMIDELGSLRRGIKEEQWRTLEKRKAHLLHVSRYPA